MHQSRPMTTLTNGTLTLRSPEPSDAAGLADAARSSFAELGPWMPWASADYGLDDAMFWITNKDETSFVILDDEGGIIGTCGLNGLDEMNRRANLGYWVRTSDVGRGVATAATLLVARYGLSELGLNRLEVIMSVENAASKRVAERVGAAFEGLLRNRLFLHGVAHDCHSYSITSLSQLS